MNMIEYTDKGSKEIGEAIHTLILKCAERKGHSLSCTISYGDNLKLDCYFAFKVHEEDEP